VPCAYTKEMIERDIDKKGYETNKTTVKLLVDSFYEDFKDKNETVVKGGTKQKKQPAIGTYKFKEGDEELETIPQRPGQSKTGIPKKSEIEENDVEENNDEVQDDDNDDEKVPVIK